MAVPGEATRRMHNHRNNTNRDKPPRQRTHAERPAAPRGADTQPEPTPAPVPGRGPTAVPATPSRGGVDRENRRPGDPGIDTLLDDIAAEPPTPGRRTAPPAALVAR
jgi:hypothetical protein